MRPAHAEGGSACFARAARQWRSNAARRGRKLSSERSTRATRSTLFYGLVSGSYFFLSGIVNSAILVALR